MFINQTNIDIKSIELKSNGFLRIEDFLDVKFAERIHACLVGEVDWDLACRINGESKKIKNCNDVTDLSDQYKDELKANSEDFQFIYNSYMMVTAYIENKTPDLFLNRLLEFLNSPETVSFFKKLTNNQAIKKLNAQATRYKVGHYLTQHNDHDDVEDREYAYVIGLTEDWRPEWGGLLHVINENDEIIKTFVPKFNTLTIFKVPQNHYVSYVNPLAKRDRLSITGWLLSN